MKFAGFISVFIVSFCFKTSAQNIALDTFLRKDGIHIVPPFEEWQAETFFSGKNVKGKRTNSLPLLSIDACDRIKYYSSAGFGDKKAEPYRFFRILDDLEAHDSAAYFQVLSDLPFIYQSFFRGLYHVEYNEFGTAVQLFDKILNNGGLDSLVLKESYFWKEMAKKAEKEKAEHNIVLSSYMMLEGLHPDSMKLMNLLQKITLPQYLQHKYINLYNYYYRKKDYGMAKVTYDSIVNYVNNSQLKTSLKKNRDAVLELLNAKDKFIMVMNNGLYHYEVDYLYDHLNAWGQDTLTDKEFLDTAGFTFSQKYTTKSDSIFTRHLADTSLLDTLSKFEVLSFSRTPLDKAGRRFIIVKLSFDREEAYNKYSSFLEKFRSKPIQQSVLYNKGAILEGNEYMLTKHFIAALFIQDDPVTRYVLSLYLLQDEEGNVYAVDTLF